MGWITHDFVCNECNFEFDDLVPTSGGVEDTTEVSCPHCRSEKVTKVLSTPKLASYSILDREARYAALRKRSKDHYHREIKNDPDSWGNSKKDGRKK